MKWVATFAPLAGLLLVLPPYLQWMFTLHPGTLAAGYALVGALAVAGSVGAWTAYRLIEKH
jgi:hypothetical protein